MSDTNHFQIRGSSDDSNKNDYKLDLHFRNVKDKDAVEMLQGAFCDGLQQMNKVISLSEVKVYRKMVMDEVKEVLKNGGLDKMRKEKWITESFKKALDFQNNIVPLEQRVNERILQMTLNRKPYEQFRRDDVIPQFKSKGSDKSVYNYEGIEDGACPSQAATVPSEVKRNVGINRNHVDKFNETIKSISVLDPDDPFVKNQFLRYLSENKLEASLIVLSVIYEAKSVIMILMDKNGQTLEQVVVYLFEKGINKIGSLITSALATLLPPIGAFAIGVLGAVIFGFIGNKVGELLFGLHNEVAPGEGPPISDYFSFIYGSNNCFGEPLSEYNLKKILKLPTSDYSVNVNAVARVAPTNNDENKYLRMAFGTPK